MDTRLCIHTSAARQLGKGKPPFPSLRKTWDVNHFFHIPNINGGWPFQGSLYLNEAGNFCHTVLTSQVFRPLLFLICHYKGIKIYYFMAYYPQKYGILLLEIIKIRGNWQWLKLCMIKYVTGEKIGKGENAKIVETYSFWRNNPKKPSQTKTR